MSTHKENVVDNVVQYDRTSFIIRGKRVLLLSGSVHYPRVHPSRWTRLFNTFREARLNTLETYVFWNEHHVYCASMPPHDQFSSPKYDFTGRKDLFGFLAAAHRAGLYVILRIGPYVCAETSYGGFPFALREVHDIRFRTLNKPFQGAVAGWLRYLAQQLHARQLMASAGGPVILVQLENEYQMVAGAYGDDGEKYLQWCSDLQHELNLGVPTIMCYGAADGAVETINAFYAHEEMENCLAARPDQPPIWTECWTGWYDVWGAPHHYRAPTDLAYAVARFFAQGGAGVNYYMWLGGTNYGRFPMYLQATSYDYDAPINEFYMSTTKSNHLTKLHNILLDVHVPIMLDGSVEKEDCNAGPLVTHLSPTLIVYKWSNVLTYVCNDSSTKVEHNIQLAESGLLLHSLQPKSVSIVNEDKKVILYKSDEISAESYITRSLKSLPHNPENLQWISREEPISAKFIQECTRESASREYVISEFPAEQLSLTHDMSDYCIYTTSYELVSIQETVHAESIFESGMTIQFEACDFAYLYINDCYCGRTEEPLWEDRKSNKWNQYSKSPGFSHSIYVNNNTLSEALSGRFQNEFTVTLVICSLGLVKGDWQLGDGADANMLREKKGLLSQVTFLRGRSSDDSGYSRKTPWTAVAGLIGEVLQWPLNLKGCGPIDKPSTVAVAPMCHGNAKPIWYEAYVVLNEKYDSLVVDLHGMGKGLLWANGILLGRYWNVTGTRERNGFLNDSPIRQAGHGSPTQRYYHIPAFVFDHVGDNSLRITLFEERGKNPAAADVKLLVVT